MAALKESFAYKKACHLFNQSCQVEGFDNFLSIKYFTFGRKGLNEEKWPQLKVFQAIDCLVACF